MQTVIRHALLIAGFMLGLASGPASRAQTASWRQAAKMPVGVQEIYADAMAGLVYVGGGIPENEAGFTDRFQSYDPGADRWNTLAPLPERRHHISISAANGRIYAMGGFTGTLPGWEIQRAVFVYDVAADAWSRGADMPRARAEHVAPVIDGKIYVIGGRVAGPGAAKGFAAYVDTNKVDVFDTGSGTWFSAAEAPTARNSQAAAVIDGKIYVVGGRQYKKDRGGPPRVVNVNALEVYDPETNRWETKAAMPLAQGGLAAAALNGRLYAFGGEQWYPDVKVFADVWVYQPELDRWKRAPSLPTPRHGLAAASVGSEIFVFGGASRPGLGAVATNEVLKVD